MIALISDIHGNIDALNAVLADIEKQKINTIWCLGDIVGYGAEPSQCIEIIRRRCDHVVLGNHDMLTTDDGDLTYLSDHVRAGILFARKKINSEHLSWLKSLPLSHMENPVTLVHASLYHPEGFSYLDSDLEARLHFQSQETPFCFIGHTHVPMISVENGNAIEWKDFGNQAILLDKSMKCSVNVGSVGQPRDQDSRACYVVYEPSNYSIQIKRVEYDFHVAQNRILDAGLPQINAARLSVGR